VINSDWWKEEDGSKRKIMAECLVPQSIAPDHIHSVYVTSRSVADSISFLSGPRISVIPEPQMFFQPTRSFRITNTLSLVDGDMFFSQRQTLTISVNTVGVMGKGLASRAKYQFPDVYVFYQDLCRQKVLQMGKPFIYKREGLVDELLADDTSPLPNPNANKWFLLFPTKRHWRDKSDINGIEEGLAWVRNNYAKEGIKSLAMPALGCGLGQLEWRDVGPLMCRYLADIGIQVSIYLPREQEVPPELLTKDFLLQA
ncbi:MAG: DarT ssDNA thymidine ADP-ribosyltransferase family protein, partial [Nitrososphaerales archaeon]